MMIVVTNTITVKKGSGGHLEERFAKPKQVHQMPGFVNLELLMNTSDEEADVYVVRTVWNDRDAYDHWVNSDAFTQGHSKREKANDHILHAKMTIYDVVHHHLAAQASEEVSA